jgi:hypothetical protein
MPIARLIPASLLALGLAGLGWGTVEAAPAGGKHSGTVIAVDRAAGTLAVEELGPWTAAAPAKAAIRRTFRVTPETRFVLVRRNAEGGDRGWPGGYVEHPLEPWAVRPGEFVTVVTDDHATARAVVVAPPGP